MFHPADPERPGSIATIHLMDILALPEYDHCILIYDEKIKSQSWQWAFFLVGEYDYRLEDLWSVPNK